MRCQLSPSPKASGKSRNSCLVSLPNLVTPGWDRGTKSVMLDAKLSVCCPLNIFKFLDHYFHLAQLALTRKFRPPKIIVSGRIVFLSRKAWPVHRLLLVVFSLIAISSVTTYAQSSVIEPLRIPSGTVLTFYLQTRLSPINDNALDGLPKGTALQVKILDPIDSKVDRDGSRFHGSLESPIRSGNAIIVHSAAQVTGVFALLRSTSHPNGFRYELLVTGLRDSGKFYALTASLAASVADAATPPVASINARAKVKSGEVEPAESKLP